MPANARASMRRPSELHYAVMPEAMPPIPELAARFPHNHRLRYGFAQQLIATKNPAACAVAGALLLALIDAGCAFEEDARLLLASLAIALGAAPLGRAAIANWQPTSAEHRAMFAAMTNRVETAPSTNFALFGHAAAIVARALESPPPGKGRLAAIGPNGSLAILGHPEHPITYALNLVYAATLDDAPIETFVCAEPDWPPALMNDVLVVVARVRPASVRLVLQARCDLPAGYEWRLEEANVNRDLQLSIDTSFAPSGSGAQRTITFAYGEMRA